MSEEQTNETTQEETENQEPNQEVFTPAQVKAEKEKIRNSMSQQLSEMQKKISAYEKQKAEEEEQALLANKDHETLISKLKEQLSTRDSEMESYKREIQNQKIDSELYIAGVKDKYARIGVMSEYNSLDEAPPIEDFVNSLKESSPTLFVHDQPKGKPSGAVGLPVQNGSGMPLEERLESKDPEVKLAALREQLERDLSGK